MTPSEVLDGAAELLSKPGAWCQIHIAADSDGEMVQPESSAACAWCAVGSLYRFVADVIPAHEALRKHLNEEPAFWNDAPGRTQAEVVSALRAAAQRAREEGR